ncbi:hypothetical protein ABPG74_003578 [Tetrahymena malaccensis]
MNSDLQNLINRVRSALLSRNQNTIRGLARAFRQLDSYDRNNKVDRDEFFIVLKENGVSLTKQEQYVLHQCFDRNNEGTVDFDEFLCVIRGELNEQRKAAVLKAFQKFDPHNTGFVEIRDLRGVYNCDHHPKIKTGQMTQEQVFVEFLQNFCDNSKDGKIQLKEWIDYYSAVSVSIQNDDHFEQVVKIAWGV